MGLLISAGGHVHRAVNGWSLSGRTWASGRPSKEQVGWCPHVAESEVLQHTFDCCSVTFQEGYLQRRIVTEEQRDLEGDFWTYSLKKREEMSKTETGFPRWSFYPLRSYHRWGYRSKPGDHHTSTDRVQESQYQTVLRKEENVDKNNSDNNNNNDTLWIIQRKPLTLTKTIWREPPPSTRTSHPISRVSTIHHKRN
jgi:hypothetical protein